MYKQEPYYKEDFQEVIANPQKEKTDYAGRKCMPVGINGTFMPTEKEDPENFKKAQYNIKERFGLLQDEDYNNVNLDY